MAELVCRLSAAPTAVLSIAVGTAKYPGIKIHEPRQDPPNGRCVARETVVSGWTTRRPIPTEPPSPPYASARTGMDSINSTQLAQAESTWVACTRRKAICYRLTEKATKVAPLFILFHKQLCAPRRQ